MPGVWPAAAAALAAFSVLTTAAPAKACALALVLAIDVSQSVDAREYALQTQAHAAAFRDPEIQRAVELVGGVSVILVHWSGNVHQQARTPWRLLKTAADMEAYAQEVERIQRRFDIYATALGALLDHMQYAFNEDVSECRRRIIDISGDGVSNTGMDIDAPRARLLDMGVTINGLVIISTMPARRAQDDPISYYRDRVIGGPGAFSLIADGFEDYARAFREKLLREIPLPVGAAPSKEHFAAAPP